LGFTDLLTPEGSIMEYRAHAPGDESAIEGLFVAAFSASEGEREGALVGNLARDLLATTDRRDLDGFVAVEGDLMVGAIFFSRLTFDEEIDVVILAPVAVHAGYQGMGIGQALINHGLREMKKKGVRIVITYGDPAFYSRVGFHPLSQETIAAPLELSQPEGWLGQSLTDDPVEAIPGRPSCVKALDDPAYW
jgi:predicted N-acetyltransferase YhbS